MIKINKYLKDLGLTQDDLPGYYKPNPKIDSSKPSQDIWNADINEYGFSSREFFNLDHTFDLLIYPRLCYFREFCNNCHPGGMTKEQWNKILDTMIEGFKLSLIGKVDKVKQQKKIKKAREYFARYYNCLWF